MLRFVVATSVIVLATAFSPASLSRLPALRSSSTRGAVCLYAQKSVANPADVARLVEEGMRKEDAVKILEEGNTLPQVSSQALKKLDAAFARQRATGTSKDFFKSYVEVEGDYIDDGWVDESAPKGDSLSGVKSMFEGLFGRSKSEPAAAAAPPAASAAAPAAVPAAASSPVWETVLDEASGKQYYWNKQTGETSWELPK